MAAKKRRKPKPNPNAVTLRGAKDVLKHLRAVHGVAWSRMTLYRRRTRPNDPLPGVMIVVERRLFFVTTDVAIRRWARKNLEAPRELAIDEG